MQSRRNFLKNAILLSGAAGFSGAFPASIQKAFAIDPAPGSSYLDAEHVVILMQENRSFDHALGTLQGVRGFNDPRAVRLANGNPVWMQSNAAGDTYAPFRLNLKDTRATWMSYLPHSRESQVDAWNRGNYDGWLDAKRSYNSEYAGMPLTLGHYTREDLPFYYALADAFTVCDQNFSGAMTSTTPNRSVFWTGTVREQQNAKSKAHIRNTDYFSRPAHWATFPERLQQNNISWKFYQNELYVTYLAPEHGAWLSNFGCNLLENFAQYNVKLAETYLVSLPAKSASLSVEIAELESRSKAAPPKELEKIHIDLARKKAALEICKLDIENGKTGFATLSQNARDLHQRAFITNSGDPDFHEVTEVAYEDGAAKRQMTVPRGDLLHQFRADVTNGKLPTVSWLAAPEKFSDHPMAPWFGAWYVSEVMDILTQNPEVWKKTIFILTYDENDGYFDHIPPYVAPDPRDPATGRVSAGLETGAEYIYREDELEQGVPKPEARTGPVGLGYRVPMIVASPWSRGGWVNSQLFNHTSTNQFLEHFLNTKFGSKVQEENISPWRRAISGDLTTIFRPFDGKRPDPLPFIKRNPFVETINNAKFKELPSDFHKLSPAEIGSASRDPSTSVILNHQEKGIRPSCALPYQLYVDGGLSQDGRNFVMSFRAGTDVFGKRSIGAPFNVYARGTKQVAKGVKAASAATNICSASYTVAAGGSLQESWPLDSFESNSYHLVAYGPNGFFREFTGNTDDPALAVTCDYESIAGHNKRLTGNLALHLINPDKAPCTVEIIDNVYGNKPHSKIVGGGGGAGVVVLNLEQSFGWYDVSVKIKGFARFEKRYAGRVETGKSSYSDPFMGRVTGAKRV